MTTSPRPGSPCRPVTATLTPVDRPVDSAPQAPVRSAVVVNPAKQIDLDQLRETVDDALAAAGWPEPLWYETTVDDPGESRGNDRRMA